MAGLTRKFNCKRCKAEFNLDVAMLSRVHRCPKCGAPRMELEFEQAPINIGGIDSAVSARHAAAAAAADASPFAPSTARGLKASPFPDAPPKFDAAPAAIEKPKWPDTPPAKELPSADINRKWLLAIPLLLIVAASAIVAVVLLRGDRPEALVREAIFESRHNILLAQGKALQGGSARDVHAQAGLPDLYAMTDEQRGKFFDQAVSGKSELKSTFDLMDLHSIYKSTFAELEGTDAERTELADLLVQRMRFTTLALPEMCYPPEAEPFDKLPEASRKALAEIGTALVQFAQAESKACTVTSRDEGDDVIVACDATVPAEARKKLEDLHRRYIDKGELEKSFGERWSEPRVQSWHTMAASAFMIAQTATPKQSELRMRRSNDRWVLTASRDIDAETRKWGEWAEVESSMKQAAAIMAGAFSMAGSKQKLADMVAALKQQLTAARSEFIARYRKGS